jgi:hypothetical protein
LVEKFAPVNWCRKQLKILALPKGIELCFSLERGKLRSRQLAKVRVKTYSPEFEPVSWADGRDIPEIAFG